MASTETYKEQQAARQVNRTFEDRDVFFMLALDMFCIASFEGYFLQLNPAWEATLGFPLNELKTKPFIEYVHPDDRLATLAETEKLRQGSVTVAFENRFLCADGAYRWLLWNATVSSDKEAYYAVGRDITSSKQAEAAAQESEKRYRDLIESSFDLIQSLTPDGHFEFVNQAWFDTLGYSKEELPELTLFDIIHNEYHEHCNILFSAVMSGRSIKNVEVVLVSKDGRLIPVEGNAMGRWRDGKVVATHTFFQDITERKRAEKMATEYREKLEAEVKERTLELVQSEKLATLGRLSAGVAHEINNPTAATQRGAKQLREKFFELQTAQLRVNRCKMSDAQLDRLLELGAFAKQRAEQPDTLNPLERSDREAMLEGWLDERGVENAWELAPTLVSMGLGPTQLDELTAHFQGEVMAPVITWLNCTYTIHRLLAEIDHGAVRIAEIVKALKSYTYMDRAPIQIVDIHEGLDNTLIILQSKLKEGVAVRREYAADLPLIQAYGSELNQVWTNIIDNAISAMNGRGELTLRTRLEGEWAVVEIDDNGPGIPEEIVPRLFEPFFTTKPPGEGTGLGLNISHNIIVQKHKGKILVTSRPGCTCFKVKLPVVL